MRQPGQQESLLRIQLKVDLHIVVIALAESVRQWFHATHAIRQSFDRVVELGVSGWPHNLEAGNLSIFFNPQFYEDGVFSSGARGRRRLSPFAVEAVMQHAAIPTELRIVRTPTSAAAARPRCDSFTRAVLSRDGFLRFFFGRFSLNWDRLRNFFLLRINVCFFRFGFFRGSFW